ncbi:MAG: type II toxin-antitoxin system RelE/ParE family toxin [Clostridiales bacterium]|nr:type II toxin-antitoxin system RelE/ParE family toxin [Clostridiales bacterium]
MAKIRYSAAAIQDLEVIGDYIASTLKSPIVALNTVNKIQDAVDKLADFPFIGPPLSGVVKTETNYRFLVCGNYNVFYHAQTDSVYISRVLYSRRDYIAILFDDAAADEPEQTE